MLLWAEVSAEQAGIAAQAGQVSEASAQIKAACIRVQIPYQSPIVKARAAKLKSECLASNTSAPSCVAKEAAAGKFCLAGSNTDLMTATTAVR